MKINLKDLVTYHDYQIGSRSISKKLGLDYPTTIYAMDKDESISRESSPHKKLVVVIEGQVDINFADGRQEVLEPSELVIIQKEEIHSLLAVQRCKFLQIELSN